MTNFGQLGIAFALLAPTWVMIQMSLTSDYDGLAGIVGFLLGGVIIPTLAIVAVIVLGLPCVGWFLLAFLLVNAALPLRWRRRTTPNSAYPEKAAEGE